MKINLSNIDFEAISVGGVETCIEILNWDLCFDIGRCPVSAVNRRRVFVTHGHMDHMSGIVYHAASRDSSPPKPVYYVPEQVLVSAPTPAGSAGVEPGSVSLNVPSP